MVRHSSGASASRGRLLFFVSVVQVDSVGGKSQATKDTQTLRSLANCILFGGEAPPGCLEAANANSDTGADLSDGVFLLIFLFSGGAPPGPPGPPSEPGDVEGDAPYLCSATSTRVLHVVSAGWWVGVFCGLAATGKRGKERACGSFSS